MAGAWAYRQTCNFAPFCDIKDCMKKQYHTAVAGTLQVPAEIGRGMAKMGLALFSAGTKLRDGSKAIAKIERAKAEAAAAAARLRRARLEEAASAAAFARANARVNKQREAERASLPTHAHA